MAFIMPVQATLTLALGWGIAMAVFTVLVRARTHSIATEPGVSA